MEGATKCHNFESIVNGIWGEQKPYLVEFWPNKSVRIRANEVDSAVLLNVLGNILADKHFSSASILEMARKQGSSWLYIGIIPGKPKLIQLSTPGITVSVPIESMRELYNNYLRTVNGNK